MNILKKFRYIFSHKQKVQSVMILFMIMIGTALELLGVSSLQPFINCIMYPDRIEQYGFLTWIFSGLNITNVTYQLVFLLALLVGIYIVKNIYLIFMYRAQYRYIYSNMRELSTRMMKSYLARSYAYHKKKSSAELLRNINQDTADFFGVIQALVFLCTEGMVVIALVIYLFITDKSVTIAVGLMLSTVIFFLYHFYRKHLKRLGERNRQCEAEVNKWVQQAFNGIKEVKVMNKENFFYDRYDHAFAGRVHSEYTYHTFISIPKPMIEAATVSALLAASALKLLLGTQPGYFVSTLSAFIVAAYRLLPSFNRITEYLGTISYQGPAVDAIYKDLKEIDELTAAEKSESNSVTSLSEKRESRAATSSHDAEKSGSIAVTSNDQKDGSNPDKPIDENGVANVLTSANNRAGRQQDTKSLHSLQLNDAIHVSDLTFQYEDGDRKILDGVSFDIEKNTSVAFIGPSGAGKTTLADIILGLLKPTAGGVRVDDTDIQTRLDEWHRTIAYIPQSIYLLDDTITANIAFGQAPEEVDMKRVQEAIDKAQLTKVIADLPDGLNTMVGENGVRFSGGQKQRIGIARALYNNPEVLVLDEATSALDNETEKAVMEAIDSLHGEMTLIIIAHRLSTIQGCDHIYRIEGGHAALEK